MNYHLVVMHGESGSMKLFGKIILNKIDYGKQVEKYMGKKKFGF